MRFVVIAALVWMCGAAAAGAAPCGRSGETGLYEGKASTPDGPFDVTLNLYCADGRIAAQVFTGMGDWTVKTASGDSEHVTVSFDSGASLGEFDMMRKDLSLGGVMLLAEDKGRVDLTRTGDALAPDAMNARLDLAPAQWREDLAFFARELVRRHANAFFFLTHKKFDEEVAELDRGIPSLNGDEVFVGLQKIAKSIGDGHTGLIVPPDRRTMPLEVGKFGDEFRIVAVGPGLEKALGAKILKIGGMPVAEVWSRILTLSPVGELEQLRRGVALANVVRGLVLHGLDVIPDRSHAVFTLQNDGGPPFDVDVKGLEPGQTVDMKSEIPATALRYRDKDAKFVCTSLAESHSVYCAWRGYSDLPRLAKEMFALVDSTKTQQLVIDMRDNLGGDYTVGYREVITPLLARADVNRKGHLYVLVGPTTFSAAMNNSAQFQDLTKATLVGETIGEKPNSYQEPRRFRLPNSHLVVLVSTLFYEFRKHGENEVRPDKEIIPTWDDVKSGRDPVLNWVLSQPVN